ncbi:MAG: hypothetical protein CMM52_16940 [Rhodospirillaceae bacterium]|nr:hypothetical protein [Rhodospirillaceae bacterium]|tara:strand:+ start:11374 stop:11874 length:501 start_codon:yes stop_codon:yes gene_type:complete
MALFITLAFILIPVIEIAVFIQLGGEIGLWNTFILIVLTAFAGTWLLRSQGLATLQRAQLSLEQQIFPMTEVFDGLCLIVAGVLLLTPGFVTDAAGFLLFLPFIRTLLRAWIWTILARTQNSGAWVNEDYADSSSRSSPNTIDGSFREVNPNKKNDDRKLPPGRNS